MGGAVGRAACVDVAAAVDSCWDVAAARGDCGSFFLPARPVNPHALRAELIERLQALVGEGRWLQADPGSDRVVLLHGTRDRNEWFGVEVALHRWAVLFAANGARTQPTATDPTENRG